VYRLILVAVVAFFMTVVYAPVVLIVSVIDSHSRVIDWIVRSWGRSIVRAAGIKISAEGFEGLDRSRRYVFVSNHHSYLDIPCLLAVVPHQVRFMAKISLFKIPLFGWALTAAGFIPIDRKNRRTAVKSFDLAGSRIRKGNSIVVFPEEGRSRHREMREFQRGAFLLALRSELPIVPVGIRGTYDIMPVGRLRIAPRPVIVRAAAPIETEGLSIRAKDELMERTRREIEKNLEQEN
jgi:1-acyl-sn-glycerol-3-phosphate acyltransferase